MAHLGRFILASLTLAFLVLAIRADDAKFDTPENAAKAWLDALVARDGKAALACLIKSEREDKKIQNEFAKQPESEEAVKVSYKLGECVVAGNDATVKATLSYSAGDKSDSMNMVLVCAKEDGEWRVCYRKTQEQTKASNPEMLRQAKESEARAILSVVKDFCRVSLQRNQKAPAKYSDMEMDQDYVAGKYWDLVDDFRIATDGKNMIAEALSKDSDDILLIRFNAEDGEMSYLGLEKKIDDAASKKDAETLLTSMRDFLRVNFAKLGAMPKSIIGDGKTLTTYSLVSEYWVVHNEFASKDNTVTLTADSINQALVAKLEFDITKGGGEVKIEDAYTKGDLARLEKARTELTEVRKALDMYRLDNGDYPDALEAIADQFDGKVPVDPFSKEPYSYEKGSSSASKTQFIRLVCFGRDGIEGGRWMPDKDIVIHIEYTPPGEDEGSKNGDGDGSKGRFR